MRVAVFGATGTIGTALLPVLAAQHEVVALSRREHAPGRSGIVWMAADAEDAASVRRALDASRLPTTWCTRSDSPSSSSATSGPLRPWPARQHARKCGN